MDKSDIAKFAQTEEDKILLAKLWDKIIAGVNRNVMVNTGFLSPREVQMAWWLLGEIEGLRVFGGHEASKRKMLIYLPDYLDEDVLLGEDSPIVCLRAEFYEGDNLTHRDFLGALMGIGIGRETVGDICMNSDSCDFLVTAQIAPYVLQELKYVGRAKLLQIQPVPLNQLQMLVGEVKLILGTLASLRLDSVVAGGFHISRTLASQYIRAGKVAVDGLSCEKPDKVLTEGADVTLRGSGKICLFRVNGKTKKGRILVEIHRYM